MMSTLFLSDLHLCVARAFAVRDFLVFLEGPARFAERLYILGDLFEYWIGDDALLPEYLPVLDGLRVLTQSGVWLGIQPGNHDFLYGESFCAATGAHLLPDPWVADVYGVRTLLMHGDLLCTKDVAYQRFRAMLRDPAWQAVQLAKPVSERIALAKTLQGQSRVHNAEKTEQLLDVHLLEAEARLRSAGALRLVHGHTHHPGKHTFWLDGQEAERIVLPGWFGEGQGGYLECQEKSCYFKTLSKNYSEMFSHVLTF
ncbi:UDP-2,3-diacylglucosamine hydrolase [Gammaproteobacteria bacterium]